MYDLLWSIGSALSMQLERAAAVLLPVFLVVFIITYIIVVIIFMKINSREKRSNNKTKYSYDEKPSQSVTKQDCLKQTSYLFFEESNKRNYKCHKCYKRREKR